MFRAVIILILFALPALAADEQQTDSGALNPGICGVCSTNGCSGSSIDNFRLMDAGGTPGSAGATETHPSASTSLLIASFRDDDGLGAACAAGTATTRLNVTTAGLFTVTEICICRGGTEIGSASGLSISLNSTGVKTQNITTSEVADCASNFVQIIYCGDVGGTHGSQSYTYTPDQIHTIPTVASTRSRAVVIQ